MAEAETGAMEAKAEIAAGQRAEREEIGEEQGVAKTPEATEVSLNAEAEAEMEAEMDVVEAEAKRDASNETGSAHDEAGMEAEMDALLEEMVNAADAELNDLIDLAENLSELVIHPNIGCILCGMQPLIGSRFTKRLQQQQQPLTAQEDGREEGHEETLEEELEGGRLDIAAGSVLQESVQIDLCSACFCAQPEGEQLAFTELAHPCQPCHDEREWVPGCNASEEDAELGMKGSEQTASSDAERDELHGGREGRFDVLASCYELD